MRTKRSKYTQATGASTVEYAFLMLFLAVLATSSTQMLGFSLSDGFESARHNLFDGSDSPGYARGAGGADFGDSVGGGDDGDFALLSEGGGTVAVGQGGPDSSGGASPGMDDGGSSDGHETAGGK